MSINLFTPCCPGREPPDSAGPGFHLYGRCGDCRCIPRYWLIDVTMGPNPPGGAGAPPAIASVSAQASGFGTTVAMNAPSGVQSGNLLELRIGWVGTQSISSVTAGWNLVDTIAAGTSPPVKEAVYWRKATGGAADTPSVTFTSIVSIYRGWVSRITGADMDAVSPVDTSNKAADPSGAGTQHTVPQVTTTGPNRLVIASIAISNGGFNTNPPTGFTDVASDNTGAFVGHAISWKGAPTAGAYGGTGVHWVAVGTNPAAMVTVAYKPAPALGPDLSAYGGRWILERVRAPDPTARCAWFSRTVDVNAIIADVDTPTPMYASPWMLVFNYFDRPPPAGSGWWPGRWTLHAGAWDNVYRPPPIGTLPGTNLYYPERADWQGVAAYLANGYPGMPPGDGDLNKPFLCLRPNRFSVVDQEYSSFPASIVAQPFWP